VTLINWLLKPKCMLIHIFEIFFVIWKYNMIFLLLFFRDLVICIKVIFFNVLTKTGYFKTGCVFLQYKNTNQYWSKWSKKFAENHRFFWNNFWRNIFFRLDQAGLTGSLTQASDPAGQIRGARELPHECMQQLLFKWIIIHLNSKT